jgi:uncharacterized membrane protein YcaP (DUF421 family)
MNTTWPILLNIAFRTTVIYAAVLVGIRLTGQRQLGQMSPFDLVLLLIIANAVQNAMVGQDTSLVGGLVAAGVLLFWHQVINRARRSSRRISRLLGGEGVLLVNDGRILADHLRRAGVTQDELLQALREHGVPSVDQVRLAVLEPDGAISVIRFEDLKPSLLSQPHHRIKGLRKGVER